MKKWIIGLIAVLLLPCVVNAETSAKVECAASELTAGEETTCSITADIDQTGVFVRILQMHLEAGESLTISDFQNGAGWVNPASGYDNYNIVNDTDSVIENTHLVIATFKLTAGDVDSEKQTSVAIRDYSIHTEDENHDNELEATGTDEFAITIAPPPLDSNNELGYIKISTVGDDVKSISLDEYIPDEIPFEVNNNVTKVKIEATPASDKATITGTGTYDLRSGEGTITTFTITVKAEDGTIRDYVVKIQKKASAKPVEEQEKDIQDNSKTETPKETTTNTTTPTKSKTVKNPKTSVALPIIMLIVLGGIAGVTYYFKRKDRFMKF